MVKFCRVVICAAVIGAGPCAPLSLFAQGAQGSGNGSVTAPTIGSAVLVMDLRAALNESEAGSALFADHREKLMALSDEFNLIQTELVAEEQKLRDLRATTDPKEFRSLAEAFDQKSTKTRKLYADRRETLIEELQQKTDRLAIVFSNLAGQIMEERGASVVLMKNQAVVSSVTVDITEDVLRRANASSRAILFPDEGQ